MDQDQIIKYAPFIAIGFFALLAIIIVPLVIRSTRKKRKQADNFFPELAQKTGLTVNHDHLEGTYKGYPIYFRYKIDLNIMAAYKTVTTGNSNVWGKNAVYPKLHVEITSDSFPTLALFDPPGLLNHHQWIQDLVEGRKPNYPKMEISGDALQKGLNFYGTDQQAAEKLLSSEELKSLLKTWKYTDIRMDGNKLSLDLDNSSAPSTIGIQKMYTHDFAIQAMNIAVAAAKALKS